MKDPMVEYLGDRPYECYEDYLQDLFVYVDIQIYAYMVKHNTKDRYTEEIEFLKDKLHQKGLLEDQDQNVWRQTIQERLEFDEELQKRFPIEWLLYEFQADDFVENVVILSVKLYLDSGYRKVIRALNTDDSGQISLELCSSVFLEDKVHDQFGAYQYAYQSAGILNRLFPSLSKADNIMHEPFTCDAGLADYICGFSNSSIAGAVKMNLSELSPLDYKEKQKNTIMAYMQEDVAAVCYLWGASGSGKKTLIGHIAKELGKEVLLLQFAPSDQNNEDSEQFRNRLSYIVRDCRLKKYILAVTEIAVPDEKQEVLIDDILFLCRELSCLFLLSENKCKRSRNDLLEVRIDPLDEVQRLKIWKDYLEGDVIKEEDIRQIANTFIMTPGQIRGAVSRARFQSKQEKVIDKEQLYKACYSQLNHYLEEKTTKVEAAFEWEDLKLDESDKSVLEDICNCVRNRYKVMNEWNFKRVVPYGAGINVIFSGPPGTGKTMAAQVIANELNMELYKVDLSQLIDKYVGETEKNIKNIFTQAARSNSILFFDEADAIFNKRMKAKDANERFANIESSLLLQCVEEYSGITILATNNMEFIDPAFIRRFKFNLAFKAPDAATRLEIWKSIMPEQMPVSEDVDLRELAAIFDFTGAVIKNVILSAAYFAAQKQEPVGMIDLLKAIAREMLKTNRILSREDMGSFGYLYSDLQVELKK